MNTTWFTTEQREHGTVPPSPRGHSRPHSLWAALTFAWLLVESRPKECYHLQRKVGHGKMGSAHKKATKPRFTAQSGPFHDFAAEPPNTTHCTGPAW
ncbi:hypothetical protein HYFRA_00013239 [Hymenoscyphus fraxineus]|uniref:Uncharacterized protein n=1 Tax=Hymenoscyphus fraxineus TaxID=746836 RepID=A0A9N9PUA6_9HELO|nr:hypothetical protein HYFRA_00013239 [Hymenoscyphus fraxineus]